MNFIISVKDSVIVEYSSTMENSCILFKAKGSSSLVVQKQLVLHKMIYQIFFFRKWKKLIFGYKSFAGYAIKVLINKYDVIYNFDPTAVFFYESR